VSRSGVLYVVATPIGNSEDISARAVRTLREVSLIACEDTRRTARLLAAHSIGTRTISYFEHNEHQRIPALLAHLESGENIALVTDAGTPAVSDPGYRLVRAAIDAGMTVTSVPGPSAVIAALSVAGLPTDRFAFEGFLPAKSGERQRLLERLASEERTLVIYEAARRLGRLLEEMAGAFGAYRRAVVVREATKTHEEIVRGTLAELTTRFGMREVLGEVSLVVEGNAGASPTGLSVMNHAQIVEVLREAGVSLKVAAVAAAKLTGVSRREIYQNALEKDRMDRH
jgi:16S rRNA (cytidine1402-2'-O)-methyltransferase